MAVELWGSLFDFVGSLLFGFVSGCITYRTLRQRGDSAGLSSIASVLAVVGSAAIAASFDTPDSFGLYGIGLAAGFFGYLIVGNTLFRTASWLGEGSSSIGFEIPVILSSVRTIIENIDLGGLAARIEPDDAVRRALRELLRPTSTPVPAPAPRPENRFANVELFSDDGPRLEATESFKPGQFIRMAIDIGERSPGSHVLNPVELPEENLPRDIDLDVMVTSPDFMVGYQEPSMVVQWGGPVAHGVLHLPADGGAATTRDGATKLRFLLWAPYDGEIPRTVHARIGYYYRNILVQSQRLTGRLGGDGGFEVVTDYTLSADLTGLDRLPERPRISILTNANDDGSHQIVIRHPGQPPAGGDKGGTITIGDSVDQTIEQLRDALTLRAPTEKARAKSQLIADLQQFVPLGRSLYQQLPGKLPAWTFSDLRANPEKFVVQVSRPTSSAFVLPWAFVYDIPMSSDVKPVLCPLVDRWDGRGPLFDEASPRKCPCGPHEKDVLCPFGFWGFRYAVEQLSKTDLTGQTIPVAPGSKFVVGEVQYGVDLGKLGNHVKELGLILGRSLPRAQLSEGKNKASVQTLLGQDIPLAYFFCHGQNDEVGDANTWLSVGNREKITAGDFTDWTQTWADAGKRVWFTVRPLVFINACHSLAISSKTLVSYLDAFMGNACAAGVIGTEVKVAQTLAMDFAEQFFTKWLNGTDVETALRAARVDFLRQGNLFGLVYTPYCWSELKVAATAAA